MKTRFPEEAARQAEREERLEYVQKRLKKEQKALRLAGGGGRRRGRLTGKDTIEAGTPKTGRRVWKIGSTAQRGT